MQGYIFAYEGSQKCSHLQKVATFLGVAALLFSQSATSNDTGISFDACSHVKK